MSYVNKCVTFTSKFRCYLDLVSAVWIWPSHFTFYLYPLSLTKTIYHLPFCPLPWLFAFTVCLLPFTITFCLLHVPLHFSFRRYILSSTFTFFLLPSHFVFLPSHFAFYFHILSLTFTFTVTFDTSSPSRTINPCDRSLSLRVIKPTLRIKFVLINGRLLNELLFSYPCIMLLPFTFTF